MLANLIFKDYYIKSIFFDEYFSENGFDLYDPEKLKLNYECEVGINEEATKCKVELVCNIFNSPSKENDIKKENIEDRLFVKVSMVGLFEHDGSLSSEEFYKMCNINGVTTLFPFLRSAVSDITRIANTGDPIILPLVNIHKMISQSTKM